MRMTERKGWHRQTNDLRETKEGTKELSVGDIERERSDKLRVQINSMEAEERQSDRSRFSGRYQEEWTN